MISEKQFNKTATTDAFDEIYTNFDVSTISDEYLADSGYPFNFPTRWLNDPSMNKRIAIRRLDVIPSSHVFRLFMAYADTANDAEFKQAHATNTLKTTITEHDNLNKVLSYLCDGLSTYNRANDTYTERLMYEYDEKENRLRLYIIADTEQPNLRFAFNIDQLRDVARGDLVEFLEFLNQPITDEMINYLKAPTAEKVFYNVWSRDRLYVHSSFSTSHRKYIGKRGDFYQNMNLLYPLPSNESIFHIFFTSDGKKTILIKHCNFDIQLCFIVNFKKSIVL